jgi:hypothetical protein
MGGNMLSKVLEVLILINKFIMGLCLIIFNFFMGFFCIEYLIFLSKEINILIFILTLILYLTCNIVMFKSFKLLR